LRFGRLASGAFCEACVATELFSAIGDCEKVKHFWDQLTKSQKLTVAAGLIFAGAVLVVQFAVVPYFEARQNVRRTIAASEKVLRELGTLGTEYGVIRQRAEEIRRVIQRRPPGFALISHLEKRAGDAGVKTNIRSMNPLPSTPAGTYEETAVEMKLDKLTMKQLTDFLYLVESPEEMIRVRRLSLVKMKESPEYLSALIQVSTYQPLAPGSR
jgi:general secretion pathway protein M